VTTKTLKAIIFNTLCWGLLAGAACFVASFIFFGTFYGGMQGSLGGPIGPAMFFGAIAIVLGTFVAGLCQIRHVNTLPTWGVLGYGLFLALLFLALLWFFSIFEGGFKFSMEMLFIIVVVFVGVIVLAMALEKNRASKRPNG